MHDHYLNWRADIYRGKKEKKNPPYNLHKTNLYSPVTAAAAAAAQSRTSGPRVTHVHYA